MALAAEVVKDHPGKGYFPVEPFESLHQRGSAACHALCVNNQKNRKVEPFSHLSSRTCFAFAVIAVKQPHDAFHNNDVCFAAVLGKAFEVVLFGQHPPVEVITGNTGDGRMMSGVNKVRPYLKGCYPQPSL